MRLVALLILISSAAFAEYGVDIVTSKDKKFEVIVVTYNDCISKFEIPKDKFELFAKEGLDSSPIIRYAIEHYHSGCK